MLISLVFSEGLYWKQLADGFERPVDMKPVPRAAGMRGSFLVVEQEGKIHLTNFSGAPQLVLDWRHKVSRRSNEQGLLSIAFCPNYAQTKKVYLNLINKKGDTEIWSIKFDPKAKGQSFYGEEIVLSFEQSHGNHNGGWIGFGPDKMLYIATGDGGSSNDPKNVAQNLRSLLGKILRIDVLNSGGRAYSIPKGNPFINVPEAQPEIFAYGLRNPWRCEWVGDSLIIADVGQNHWEEINKVRMRDLSGANFGWRLREGFVKTPKKKVGGELPDKAVEPVIVYSHDTNQEFAGLSITGGLHYEGSIKHLRGRYFFADYVWPRIWSVKFKGNAASSVLAHHEEVLPDKGEIRQITSFARDHDGEIYLLCFSGIFQLFAK